MVLYMDKNYKAEYSQKKNMQYLTQRETKINHNYLQIIWTLNVNRLTPVFRLRFSNFNCQITLPQATYTFLSSFSKDNNNLALTFAASSTHSLYKTNWALLGIKTYYKVNFSNIQTFFTNASRHQCIVTTTTKLFHDLKLKFKNSQMQLEENCRSKHTFSICPCNQIKNQYPKYYQIGKEAAKW